MARRKKKYDPRQLTFNFEVMADHIETINHENAQSDEVVNHARQTDSSSGNRPYSASPGNDQRGTQREIRQLRLFDLGQMGAESAGRPTSSGNEGTVGFAGNAGHTDADGIERSEQRFGMAGESTGDERLGNFAERRDRYEPENYRISQEDRLGYGGAKTKFADNIAAIRLLKDLQERKVDVVGPEEKKLLVRYVGWGGLPQMS